MVIRAFSQTIRLASLFGSAFSSFFLLTGCPETFAPVDEHGQPVDTPQNIGNKIDGFTVVDTSKALSARQWLIRASLDLRGVRPSQAEFDLVTENPDNAEVLIDGFVDDARFLRRVRDWWAPALRTRAEMYLYDPNVMGNDYFGFISSVGEEPLMLLSYLVANNRPYTDWVTADFTVANSSLHTAWPLENFSTDESSDESLAEPSNPDWRPSFYTDGRPHAGVLSSNAFYWRFPSDGINYGRGRANAISRAFLCEDFLSRPIDFPRSIDLTDPVAVANAVRQSEGCIGCHAAVDPLASYLAGFQYTDPSSVGERTFYHPERERSWRTTTQMNPAFFGQSGQSLRDLGQQLAGDPRYVGCAVKRVYENLLGRESNLQDDGSLSAHREVFLANNLDVKALVRSVVRDPAYRGVVAESPFGGSPATPTPAYTKTMTPEIWSDSLVAMTGYRLTLGGGYDATANDFYGVRSLAGGADAVSGTQSPIEPRLSMALVHERLAEGAADFTLQRVVAGAGNPDAASANASLDALLQTFDLQQAPTSENIAALHLFLFGQDYRGNLANEAITAPLALWQDLFAVEKNAPKAWSGLLSAFLRDPESVLY